MPIPDIDASSKASTRTQTVNDTGQLIEKGSRVAQGGSTFLDKSASIGTYNFANQKLGNNASLTLNVGASQDDLNRLVGNVTQATSAQIAALQQSTGQQLDNSNGATAEIVSQLTDTFKGLLGQKTDAQAGNPKTLLWLGIAALAAVSFLAFRKR